MSGILFALTVCVPGLLWGGSVAFVSVDSVRSRVFAGRLRWVRVLILSEDRMVAQPSPSTAALLSSRMVGLRLFFWQSWTKSRDVVLCPSLLRLLGLLWALVSLGWLQGGAILFLDCRLCFVLKFSRLMDFCICRCIASTWCKDGCSIRLLHLMWRMSCRPPPTQRVYQTPHYFEKGVGWKTHSVYA